MSAILYLFEPVETTPFSICRRLRMRVNNACFECVVYSTEFTNSLTESDFCSLHPEPDLIVTGFDPNHLTRVLRSIVEEKIFEQWKNFDCDHTEGWKVLENS
jgi:hypothetical protein